ncbi:MAG: SiaB family protein kinase [Bacteroidales bacterium]|nr:SiaB family protein kinase [Bacteroidales bacterium]
MTPELGSKLFDIAYPLFQRISNDDFEYVYRGYFSHNITKKILFLADTNISKVTSQQTLQKRIYYIMVEGLQNITRHQDEIANLNTEKYPGIFAIQKNGERYYISTGNIVANENIPALKEKLDTINSLNPDELKKFHREMLTTGSMSDKGGAGLGLIEMSRKSGNKLLYSFEQLDNEYTYFYLQTLIPNDKNYGNTDPDGQNTKGHSSLDSVKQLHKQMNNENLLLYFNGFFNQENLLSLLAIIKGRMNMPLTTIKVSNVMVEMLQNIIKHGDRRTSTSAGVSGVFFMGQTGKEIMLTSGNIIKNEAKDIISERLEFVNGMSKDELSDYYDDILLDFDTADAKKTGLGFSDLRIKSDRPLKYRFMNINEAQQFYILQTAVTIKN